MSLKFDNNDQPYYSRFDEREYSIVDGITTYNELEITFNAEFDSEIESLDLTKVMWNGIDIIEVLKSTDGIYTLERFILNEILEDEKHV